MLPCRMEQIIEPTIKTNGSKEASEKQYQFAPCISEPPQQTDFPGQPLAYSSSLSSPASSMLATNVGNENPTIPRSLPSPHNKSRKFRSHNQEEWGADIHDECTINSITTAIESRAHLHWVKHRNSIGMFKSAVDSFVEALSIEINESKEKLREVRKNVCKFFFKKEMPEMPFEHYLVNQYMHKIRLGNELLEDRVLKMMIASLQWLTFATLEKQPYSKSLLVEVAIEDQIKNIEIVIQSELLRLLRDDGDELEKKRLNFLQKKAMSASASKNVENNYKKNE